MLILLTAFNRDNRFFLATEHIIEQGPHYFVASFSLLTSIYVSLSSPHCSQGLGHTEPSHTAPDHFSPW